MHLSLSSLCHLHHIMESIISPWSHLHPLCRSSRSQMFFIIGLPKYFPNFTGKHRCFLVKFAKFLRTPFFTEHLRRLLLSILLFMNLSSFTSPLVFSHYFLTVLLFSSFKKKLSSLCHYYYIITVIIIEWFIRIDATAMSCCTAISMIVISITALIEFMLKRKKITYE